MSHAGPPNRTEQTALLRWHRRSPARLVGGVAETFLVLVVQGSSHVTLGVQRGNRKCL
jgi:hypothetical protein